MKACRFAGPVVDIAEVRAIVKAEYGYWKSYEDADGGSDIGAMGACSNILAALLGWRAPWHPGGCDHVPDAGQMVAEEHSNRTS